MQLVVEDHQVFPQDIVGILNQIHHLKNLLVLVDLCVELVVEVDHMSKSELAPYVLASRAY